MPITKAPGSEPIPGYRLIEPLGSGGFGEVWKCEAPGSLVKAMKFVHGSDDALDCDAALVEQEFNALQRIKEVRHPFILSTERIERIHGELIIVMELAEGSLQDRMEQCRATGLPGIPREELLAYLRDAAEALDWMNGPPFDLQHLDIKPRNLFVIGKRVKVADFGLVKALESRTASRPANRLMGGVTPLYAAPETFRGIISRRSDQYSLAIVYMELLTGQRPFDGKTPRQLALQHNETEPDLSPLPEADRPAVAKALAKKPEHRFPTCLDFIRALKTGHAKEGGSTADRLAHNASSWSMPATLEDLFLSPADDLQDSNQDQSPKPLSPEEMVRQSVTVAQPWSGYLRPTLIIGLGNVGRQAVQALRCRMIDRYGSLTKVPLFRYLVIDTDLQDLDAALVGPPEHALHPNEVQYLPLQRITEHRRNQRDFDLAREWLPLEKWYAARSLETNGAQGSRGLGRLALYYNYSRLASRIRHELKLVNDPKNLAHAVSETGLPLRSESPQVYILTAACGGTGSGVLIDLAYAIRRQLRALGHSEDEIVAWLMTGVPGDPATPPEEQSNLYATLAEIHHFSDPATEFIARYAGGASPVEDQGPPFQAVYLVRMSHRSPEVLRETTARMAGYVFHDLTTPLGTRISQSRLAQRMKQETPFRTFGTYTVWFPRGLMLRVAARGACQQLLNAWQTPSDDPDWQDAICQACDHRLEESPWELESLLRRIEETAAAGPDGPPTQAITAFLTEIEMQAGLAIATEDPTIWCRQAIERVREWVGSGVSVIEETTEWRKSKIHRLFTAAAQKVAEEYSDLLAQPALAMFDQPGFRLSAAEVAYDHLLKRCEQLADEHRVLVREQAQLTEKCWQRVDQAFDACMQSTSFFLFGGRIRKLLRVFVDRLAAYARQRLNEEAFRSVLTLYSALQGRIKDLQRDLALCRQRLRGLEEALLSAPEEEEEELRFESHLQPSQGVAIAQQYSSTLLRGATTGMDSHIVWPEGAADLETAAELFLDRIPSEQWAELDVVLQEQVLTPLGGLGNICIQSFRDDLTRVLGSPLLEITAEFLGRLLPVTDVCSAEATSAENMEIDLPAQLRAYYHLARPSFRSTEEDNDEGFLVLPDSDAGKAMAQLARKDLPDVHVIHVPDQTNMLICREKANVGPAELKRFLETCEPAYLFAATSPLTTPHARCDINDWIPLEVLR